MPTDNQPPHLLLLPPPPAPPSRPALSSVYRPSISAALSQITGASSSPSQLVIAVACSVIPTPSAVRWEFSQSLLAGLYTIVAAVCAEKGIATDVGAAEPRSVDVRVVLVDYEREKQYRAGEEKSVPQNSTIIRDFAAFASQQRQWQTIFHPSSESGYKLLTIYRNLVDEKYPAAIPLVTVDSGASLSVKEAVETTQAPQETFDIVCLGGTFDHLHPGHKLLLHATALLLKCQPGINSSSSPRRKPAELIIGISGDALLQKKQFAEQLQPWPIRARSVISFLSTVLELSPPSPEAAQAVAEASTSTDELRVTMLGGSVLVRCVNLGDPFGPTTSEEPIQAIVVSGETRDGGRAINDKRTEKGWQPLKVFEIDVLDAREVEAVEDDGANPDAQSFESKISSTMIRKRKAEATASV